MSEFVDTNVFIRFLTNDDPAKTQRCLALFEQAEQGKLHLFTSESVLAEIVYVLSSRIYSVSHGDIARSLRPLLENRGLTIEHKQTVAEALSIYEESSLDFEDCLSIAHSRRLGLDAIYSYDRDFDRFPSVRRLEP
jgi:predicted nucleic acid-binding protein